MPKYPFQHPNYPIHHTPRNWGGGWGPWGGGDGVIGVLEWMFGHMNTCPFGQDNSPRPWTINFEMISITSPGHLHDHDLNEGSQTQVLGIAWPETLGPVLSGLH